jgi:phosphatidylserine/phosphatidylglycerophosphate/cardiolipin synthase-like enzyme
MKMRSKLALFSFLFCFSITSVWAQTVVNSNKDIEHVLSLTRQIYAQPLSAKIITDTFKTGLKQSNVVTETQIIAFLNENPSIWPGIESYLKATESASRDLTAKLKKIDEDYLKAFQTYLPEENQNDPLMTVESAESILTALPEEKATQEIKDVLKSYNLERLNATYEAQEITKPIYDEYTRRLAAYLSSPEVKEKFKPFSDPLKPLELSSKSGGPSYEVLGTYVNHPIKVGTKLIPAANLKAQALSIIRRAKHEIAINVFDFDLMDVADELVNAKKRGLTVHVGIDRKVVAARPEVQAVFDQLSQGGVMVYGVNSVGLNHQKLIVIDWSDPGRGYVLLSSGNLTQSCIGPEGDLVGLSHAVPESKPNANHMVLVKSDLLSSVVHHEIAKIIDEGLRFRGKNFPVGGVYQFRSKQGVMKLAFSPNGASKSINKNFIAQAVSEMNGGDLKFVQFAFSSKTVESGILEWAKRSYEKQGRVPLYMLVDKPFGMQDWSIPLAISGMKLEKGVKDAKGVQSKSYVEDKTSLWLDLLHSREMKTLRSQIKIASKEFQQGKVMVDGVSRAYTIKIHHKLAVGGPKNARIAIIGSFNFSSGAEKNQEFIARFDHEPMISKMADGIADYLYDLSDMSVYDEAIRRNRSNDFEPDVGTEVDAPAPRQAPKNPAQKSAA